MIKIAGFDPELTQMSEGDGETLARLADAFSEQDLVRFFTMLTKTEQDIRLSSQPRFQLEIGLLKLTQATRLLPLEDALARLEEIQAKLEGTTIGSRLSSPGPAYRSTAPQSQPTRAASPSAKSPARSMGSQASRSAQRSEQAPPPPSDHEPYEIEPELPPERAASRPRAQATRSGDDSSVQRIKEELEKKNKRMILSWLEKGELVVDGDYLRVSYPSSEGALKKEIEEREKRKAIEDACQTVLGRRISLLVVVAAPQAAEGITRKSATVKSAPGADSNPKLRAIADAFHGDIVEVIKPEHGDQ
jgi:DNA polymerase-3 subunit gamma/tau